MDAKAGAGRDGMLPSHFDQGRRHGVPPDGAKGARTNDRRNRREDGAAGSYRATRKNWLRAETGTRVWMLDALVERPCWRTVQLWKSLEASTR